MGKGSALELKPGNRLKSAVSDVEIIVIRAAGDDLDLRCGDVAMVDVNESSPTRNADAELEGSVALGKRYVNDADTLEVLCTKPGDGALTIGDQPLLLKTAKPLPSSD